MARSLQSRWLNYHSPPKLPCPILIGLASRAVVPDLPNTFLCIKCQPPFSSLLTFCSASCCSRLRGGNPSFDCPFSSFIMSPPWKEADWILFTTGLEAPKRVILGEQIPRNYMYPFVLYYICRIRPTVECSQPKSDITILNGRPGLMGLMAYPALNLLSCQSPQHRRLQAQWW